MQDLQEKTFVDWNLSKKKADEFSSVYTKPIIPVLEIVEENGVDVVFQDFGKFSEKVAGFCDFKNGKIFVNSKDKIERQLFTIAHEFGHWVLHKKYFEKNPEKYPVLPRYQSVGIHNIYEKEANSFAANLLVPEKLLLPVKDAPLSYLADIFGVSKTMMEFRVKNVG